MSSAHTPSNSHPDSSDSESEPVTPEESEVSSAAAESSETAASQETEIEYSQVRVRRAPSVVAFMMLGLVLGLIAAFISVITGPGDPSYSETSVFGVIAVIYGSVGVALGALLALWLDRRSLKKSITARVEPEDDDNNE